MSKVSEKQEVRRKYLLETAVSVFINKGFEEATMREIASSAGLTTGALYHHFKNKEELFYHAVKEAMYFTKELSETDANKQRKSKESMLGEISRKVRERMSKLAEQRLMVMVTGYILAHKGDNLDDLREEYLTKITKVADMYYFAFGIENESYKKQLASILIAALDGIAIQYSVGAIDVEDEAFKDTFVSFFVSSIPLYLQAHPQ